MFNKLIESFINKEIDEPLLDVVVKDGDEEFSRGNGRIYYPKASNYAIVEFFGTSKASHNPFETLFWAKNGHFNLYATTKGGSRVWTTVEYLAQTGVYLNIGMYDWKLFPKLITIENELGAPEHILQSLPVRMTAATDRVWQSIFYRETKTESKGFRDHFGVGWDWLDLKIDSAEIRFAKAKGDFSALDISMPAGSTAAQIENVATAFLKSISFALGGKISCLAHEIQAGNKGIVQLNLTENGRRHHSFSTPPVAFGSQAVQYKEFLLAGTNYFLNNIDSPLKDALYEFWESELVSWFNRKLSLGVWVERLAYHVLEHYEKHSPLVEQEKRARESEAFKQVRSRLFNECDTLVKSWKLSEDDGLRYRRIRENVDNMHTEYASDKIARAGRLLGVLITDEELFAWRKTRNPTAHVSDDKLDEETENKYFCQTLSILHKLGANLIGWNSNFVDYALPDGPQVVPMPLINAVVATPEETRSASFLTRNSTHEEQIT